VTRHMDSLSSHTSCTSRFPPPTQRLCPLLSSGHVDDPSCHFGASRAASTGQTAIYAHAPTFSRRSTTHALTPHEPSPSLHTAGSLTTDLPPPGPTSRTVRVLCVTPAPSRMYRAVHVAAADGAQVVCGVAQVCRRRCTYLLRGGLALGVSVATASVAVERQAAAHVDSAHTGQCSFTVLDARTPAGGSCARPYWRDAANAHSSSHCC